MLRLVNACLAMAVVIGACGLYVIKTDTRRLEASVQSQERAQERLVDDIAVLRAERAHLARPERLERIAREQGLVPLHEAQLIRIEDILDQSVRQIFDTNKPSVNKPTMAKPLGRQLAVTP
jgi:cell division protein FtsL